ncbi:phosphatidylinositol-specific phospholipase C/glycerophosphodiester phosphodiesterase family protein [Bacillus thermotolerans]|uniref:Altered inheritance of mitochondria protein 6 n=1 Tax=Bacillus thermotolerans TaxID=1221996 RepID=A0A0F5I2V8_BACTR|nr:phosphatidylinositol-specific phospholipase C/glycerophosphodiester phosphodiesterase family protein [Bacillus thermotolerans]KKB40004.1 putative secreted protein [Bacillus thermotolerans]
MKKWGLLLTLLFAALVSPLTNAPAAAAAQESEEDVLPLAKAHAHNDYEHDRPLLDALSHDFTSVESDVWLVDGELLVAHDKEDVDPNRTLQSLYLDPLMEKAKKNSGSIHPGYKHEFILWIDIKSDGAETYQAIHKQLRKYQSMLTKFTPGGVKPGAVTVYISGNRPRDLMENQKVRYAAYDGRMSDFGTEVSNEFMPIISDNWTNHFTWTGSGEMPEAEREKLYTIVSTSHANGQKVRFWATPDLPTPQREAIWQELLKAGVDFINTDDLAGLQGFLTEYDPQPAEPHITWEETKQK